HRLEPRPDIGTEAQQPGDVAEHEMDLEDRSGRHGRRSSRYLRLGLKRLLERDDTALERIDAVLVMLARGHFRSLQEAPDPAPESRRGQRRRPAGHCAPVLSKTAVRIPSRPSIRLRPRLVASCAKSGPITTPRLGEG